MKLTTRDEVTIVIEDLNAKVGSGADGRSFQS